MTQKATCPNCGAEGTVGRYCEFCGTKIPAPIVKQTVGGKTKEHKPRIVKFSTTKNDAIEQFLNYLYKERVSFENVKIKIISVKTYSIPFIAYNVSYEYYWTGENEYGIPDNGSLKDKQIFILPAYDKRDLKLPSFDRFYIRADNDLYVNQSVEDRYETNFDVNISKSKETPNEIWNRLGNETITSLMSSIRQGNFSGYHSAISELHDNGVPITIPFYVIHFKLDGEEHNLYIDGLGKVCSYIITRTSKLLKTAEERVAHYKNFENFLKKEDVDLTESQKENLLKINYPSFDFWIIEKNKEAEIKKGIENKEVEIKKEETEIKTKRMEKSCLTILLVVVCVITLCIGLIQYSKHVEQVKLEKEKVEMAERHIKDSIKHEKAMQLQKEIRKKQNFRPSAPTPSYSDVAVIGLANGIKQIRKTSQDDNTTIYEFDKQGDLIAVKKKTSYASDSYVIKQGKLISNNGTEVEYDKVGANEDIISCNNYTLCNVIYDNKNRIVKIKQEYHSCNFAYDEGNNAHEVINDFWGDTKTKEEISIPILDIIGCSIYIPRNWKDKITSSDEQGRPTEITYDGNLSKETIKIAYW